MTESTENKTVAPREPHLTGEVLESARAGQQSASDAVRKFTKTVDDALRERREAIREDSALHSLRTTIVSINGVGVDPTTPDLTGIRPRRSANRLRSAVNS